MADTTVLLWHGFMRSPRHVAAMIQRLEREGLAVMAPHVRGPIAMNRAAPALRAVGALLDSSPASVVIVAHSAGAALGAWAARSLPPIQRCGLVLADGTDNLVQGFMRTLPVLRGMPVSLVDAEPSPCNRHGALTRQILAAHDRVQAVRVPGAGHGDFERDVAGQRNAGPSALYARVCGDRSSDAIADQFQEAVVAAVLAMLAA